VLALVVALALMTAAYRRWTLSLMLAGFAWTALHLHEGAALRAGFEQPRELELTGSIASLPARRGDLLEFRFRPVAVEPAARLRSPTILVRWYRDPPELHMGEKWRLRLQLKPARSRLNFSGADRERWYFGQDIVAVANVKSGELLPPSRAPPRVSRQQVRERLSDVLDGHPARGVILALAVADRSQLEAADWDRYRLTGTSHLLAISGMHVGLAALLGFALGRLALFLLPANLGLALGLRLPWLCGLATATWYAVMAGLGTSTRRALLMLLVLALASLLARPAHGLRILALALVVVLLCNPLAPLDAGFWLSFLAVAVLVMIFRPRQQRPGRIRALLLAQLGLGLVLMPASLYWFQQVTGLGLLANLVAIPWVSLAVVPPTILATMLAPLAGNLDAFLLLLAAEAARLLEYWMTWLEPLAGYAARMGPRPGLALAIAATLGASCWLLPRGLPQRMAGSILLLPLLLPDGPRRGDLRLEMLDVGQGLAVLVRTREQLLLYDSGPGDGQSWSLVPGVVAPAIASSGHSPPDRVVISHRDLDHAGGQHELLTRYPRADFLLDGTRLLPGAQPCISGLTWASAATRFRVLHPSPGLPYLGNDSSCVISIEAAGGRVLLPGDISRVIEQRLLLEGLGPHDLLLLAHHGSRSSSDGAFIQRVNPKVALVAAGFGNRFGFPHGEVRRGLAQQGVLLLSSADCGAIRVRISSSGEFTLKSARRSYPAIWHWPPAAECP